MEDTEEFIRNENGKRVRVKRITETYSNKTKKVHESVQDMEALGENWEEKHLKLDAHERNIEEKRVQPQV